jgi:broad specificity phosphatase PhoE
MEYHVVYLRPEWFVRTKTSPRATLRPVGEGYVRAHDALRGALRRRVRDGHPKACVLVHNVYGTVVDRVC